MDDERNNPAEPLNELARLQRGMRVAAATWSRFREAPSAEDLEHLRIDLAAALRHANALRLALEAGTGGGNAPGRRGAAQPVPAPWPPPARTLIEAGRTLDRLLWQIIADWKDLRGRVSVGGLGRLASQLRMAREQAATVREALAGSSEPAPEGHPTGQQAAVAQLQGPGALDVEIDSLLWRIQSDWQHLRRGPAPDRVGLLEDELEAAAARVQEVERLWRIGRVGPAKSGAEGQRKPTSGVHFPPYRDGFTGAYNRDGFDALAGAELKRCRRYGRSFGLLLLEVRPVELRRLRDEVQVLQETLRAYDLLSRYDDRLLVAGLPESGGSETRRVASRILRELREQGMAADVVRLAYATLPEDGSTMSDLMRVAGEKLEKPYGGPSPS